MIVFLADQSRALRRNPQSQKGLARSELESLRGGGLYNFNSERDPTIELNPNYANYVPPPAPLQAQQANFNQHDAWLQHQNNSIQRKNGSLLNIIQQYMANLHQTIPSLYWTTISCVAVFALWQIPAVSSLLVEWFICSRRNLIPTGGISLLLSACSHASFYHLLVNLATLLRIGPQVRNNITQPLWPLMLGSAVISNAFFLSFRRHGSCMGLSGVTMSLIAVQARAFPKRLFGMVVGVFPVTLPAEHILQILMVVSLVGSFATQSRIAHLTHLGGLLFGLLYYELFVIRHGNPWHTIRALLSNRRRLRAFR